MSAEPSVEGFAGASDGADAVVSGRVGRAELEASVGRAGAVASVLRRTRGGCWVVADATGSEAVGWVEGATVVGRGVAFGSSEGLGAETVGTGIGATEAVGWVEGAALVG